MIPVPTDVDMVVAESSEGENREQPMDHSGSAGGASAAAAVHPHPPSAVSSDAATTAGVEQSTRQDPTAVGGQQASKKPQERLEVLPSLLTKATICR